MEGLILEIIAQAGLNAAIVGIMWLWMKDVQQRVEHLKDEVNKWQTKYVDLQERTLEEFKGQMDLIDTLYQHMNESEK
jgi:hypothetical protein